MRCKLLNSLDHSPLIQRTFTGSERWHCIVSVTPEAMVAQALSTAARNVSWRVEPDAARQLVAPLYCMQTSTLYFARFRVEYTITARMTRTKSIPTRTGFFKLGHPPR